MKIKKKYLSNKKEKAILSDVLPFEVPIVFSNRHFLKFLVDNNISKDHNKLTWKPDSNTLTRIIKLLFGITDDLIKSENNGVIEIQSKSLTKFLRSIPYSYKISHNTNEFRELTVVHPINQLALIEFYNKYKYTILYFTSISPFSIRKPHRVARYVFYKDKTHILNLAHDHEHTTVEEFDKEYENLKTFFAYKEVSNIYKFYESYKYQRCEKKYDHLYKFDISKCFDSIYTHSISWALLNKEIIKNDVELSRTFFGDKFDTFMQNLNYGETNGIVIGPEFSRIFAELILQQIDKKVFSQLENSSQEIKNKVHYEIYRYVDDYFIFYNDDQIKDEILKTFRLVLKEFKLYISEKKSYQINRPLITSITRAKLKITDLLNEFLSIRVVEKTVEEEKELLYDFYVSANKLITRFKSIVKETEIDYNEILNYTLACIDKKVIMLIKIYEKIEENNKYDSRLIKDLVQILDFTFFLYSVSPKVNTTIKLCIILSKITKLVKVNDNFNYDLKHLVLKKIYDEIFLVLKKYRSVSHTQVETLYLLVSLNELGREYRLDEKLLCDHFGIDLINQKCAIDLNYFSIVVLLFYMGNKTRYNRAKLVIKTHILSKFKNGPSNNLLKTSELTFLFFDLIKCPFLDTQFKYELFTFYGIDSSQSLLRTEILAYNDFWFTKWTNFNFIKELEAKKSQEVY